VIYVYSELRSVDNANDISIVYLSESGKMTVWSQKMNENGVLSDPQIETHSIGYQSPVSMIRFTEG
jgi:hypothetical protein